MSVQINGRPTPTAGENYQLTCSVSGAGNLNPNTTYRWTKDNGTQTEFMSTTNTLNFSPLRLTNAADYVCEATINSVYLADNVVAASINQWNVRIDSEYQQRV